MVSFPNAEAQIRLELQQSLVSLHPSANAPLDHHCESDKRRCHQELEVDTTDPVCLHEAKFHPTFATRAPSGMTHICLLDSVRLTIVLPVKYYLDHRYGISEHTHGLPL